MLWLWGDFGIRQTDLLCSKFKDYMMTKAFCTVPREIGGNSTFACLALLEKEEECRIRYWMIVVLVCVLMCRSGGLVLSNGKCIPLNPNLAL